MAPARGGAHPLIDQVHYTSCEQEFRKGFQIQAASPGVSALEMREVERLCASLAPDSLAYQRLSGGRFVLAHTRDVGRDYSGRSGNFFSHALVFTTLPFPPIFAWEAPFWVSSGPLAELDLRPGPLTEEDVVEWASEHPDREAFLAGLHLESQLELPVAEAARWIALASLLGCDVSFNTCVREARHSEARLVGSGGRWKPGTSDFAADAAALVGRGRPELLERWRTFAAPFPDEEREPALAAFSLAHLGKARLEKARELLAWTESRADGLAPAVLRAVLTKAASPELRREAAALVARRPEVLEGPWAAMAWVRP